MKPMFTLKVPTNGFTFKPVSIKPKKIPSSYKPLTKTLYALAVKNDNGEWEAHVNTKGIEGYNDVTVVSFTDKSFELKGRNNIFRINKDKTGHWVRVIRTDLDAELYPGNTVSYCSLCENCVFSGHIVKIDGISKFDMSVYQGTSRECSDLLTMINKIKKDEEG